MKLKIFIHYDCLFSDINYLILCLIKVLQAVSVTPEPIGKFSATCSE